MGLELKWLNTLLSSTGVVIGAGSSLIGKMQPFAAITEIGLTEIIDKDDQVDQNDYSASVELALGGTYSGEILGVVLRTSETGSGAVLTPAGYLLFLDADPAASAGDTALTAAEWGTVIGRIAVESGDWISDGGGAVFCTDNDNMAAIPFHALSSLFAVWQHTDATSFNDAAGDDEELHMNAWYRRDS